MLLHYSLATALVALAASTSVMSGQRAHPWDELIFTQTWPKSFCIQLDIQKEHSCLIPANVTTWNIHGIWPSNNNSFGPIFCNKTDKFNVTKLVPIRDQLLKYWANMFKKRHVDSLWSHEWKKHGTCAETLAALDTELKYFSTGLKFNRRFDLLNILAQSNIVPDKDAEYKMADIEKAFTNALGISPKMQCFVDDGTPRQQFLVQVEVCMDTTYKLVQCTHKLHVKTEWNRIPSVEHQRLRRAAKQAMNEPCNPKKGIRYPAI